MELWTAFILGLVGSLHCAAMCGPLALALPVGGTNRCAYLLGRSAYNLGRLIAYAALGALFGLLGQSLAVAGLQRWVSLGAGAAILVALAASSRFALKVPVYNAVGWLKSGVARLMKRGTIGSLLMFGALNGLLPCGLVYVACAGAVATGGFASGLGYMIAFGLGTVPMMFGLSLMGVKLRFVIGSGFQRLIPISVAALGVLLVIRGLGLGIPYLSPDISGSRGHCSAVHPAESPPHTAHQHLGPPL